MRVSRKLREQRHGPSGNGQNSDWKAMSLRTFECFCTQLSVTHFNGTRCVRGFYISHFSILNELMDEEKVTGFRESRN